MVILKVSSSEQIPLLSKAKSVILEFITSPGWYETPVPFGPVK